MRLWVAISKPIVRSFGHRGSQQGGGLPSGLRCTLDSDNNIHVGCYLQCFQLSIFMWYVMYNLLQYAHNLRLGFFSHLFNFIIDLGCVQWNLPMNGP